MCDMLASKVCTSISTPGPWVPSCVCAVPKIPRPTVTSPLKVTGCRARRIKQHCGERRMGGGHLWPVATWVAGGRRGEVLSQLLLHVSYVFPVSLAVASEILSGLEVLDPRIESHRGRVESSCRVPDPTLMCCSLCHVAVCAVFPAPRRGEDIQAPTRLPGKGPLCLLPEPSQPPGPLDRQPCHTHRDPTSRPLLFGLCDSCWTRGWYLPHDGTQRGKKQTLGWWLAGWAGLDGWLCCLTASCSCYWAVNVTV